MSLREGGHAGIDSQTTDGIECTSLSIGISSIVDYVGLWLVMRRCIVLIGLDWPWLDIPWVVTGYQLECGYTRGESI